jgi:cysteine desulfurase/selenocysteine lyase
VSTWAAVPHKFEAGTPDVAGAVGMAAAADYLTALGHDARYAHEQELIAHAQEVLARVPGLRMFGPRDPAERIAVFSFELAGVHPHDVATILDGEGVAVRAGHHCAQILMRCLRVPATTRASAYIYNTIDDFDRLGEALALARAVFA